MDQDRRDEADVDQDRRKEADAGPRQKKRSRRRTKTPKTDEVWDERRRWGVYSNTPLVPKNPTFPQNRDPNSFIVIVFLH